MDLLLYHLLYFLTSFALPSCCHLLDRAQYCKQLMTYCPKNGARICLMVSTLGQTCKTSVRINECWEKRLLKVTQKDGIFSVRNDSVRNEIWKFLMPHNFFSLASMDKILMIGYWEMIKYASLKISSPHLLYFWRG